MWREIGKHKLHLSRSFPNVLFHFPSLGSISDFQDLHKRQLLSNLELALGDECIPGTLTRLNLRDFSLNSIPVEKAPYTIKGRSHETAVFWINTLVEYNIQFRSMDDLQSHSLAIQLPNHVYSTIAKTLQAMNLITLQDVRDASGLFMKPLHLLHSRRMPINDPSFNPSILDALIEELCEPLVTSSQSSIDTSLTQLRPLKRHYASRSSIPFVRKTRTTTRAIALPPMVPDFVLPPPSSTLFPSENPLLVYTDGSLTNDGRLGSGGVIFSPHSPAQAFSLRPQAGRSSTAPELYAILAALSFTPTNQTLTLFTDSQCALDGLKFLTSSNYSTRHLLKRPNHSLLAAIRDLLLLRTAIPTFIKVKAHVGILGNEMADRLANSATVKFNLSRLPSSPTIFKFQDDKVIDMPTRQFAKSVFLVEQTRLVSAKILRNFSYESLDVPLTLQLLKQIPKYSSLHIFMLKHLALQLPTAHRQLHWTSTHLPLSSATCCRCRLFQETEFHLWNCEKNDKAQLKAYTIDSARRRFAPLASSFPPLPHIVDLLFDCDPFFSQELISTHALRRFLDIPTEITCAKRRHLAQIKVLLICYSALNDAFHSLIWKERNDIYHRSDPATFPVTPLHDPPPLTLGTGKKRSRTNPMMNPLPSMTVASRQVVASKFCFRDTTKTIPLHPSLPAVLSPVANP